LKDPEGFLREKLSKKVLSANTIRDAILAAFLIALQKKEAQEAEIPDPEDWRRVRVQEIRGIMSKAFSEIDAPSEYPTASQLKRVQEVLEQAYDWDKIPEALKKDFDLHCEALFKKFDLGL